MRLWGWDPHDEISALKRRDTREPSLFLWIWGYSSKVAIWKLGRGSSLEPDHAGNLIFGFQNCQNISLRCWTPPRLCYFVRQPKLSNPQSFLSIIEPIVPPPLLTHFSQIVRHFLRKYDPPQWITYTEKHQAAYLLLFLCIITVQTNVILSKGSYCCLYLLSAQSIAILREQVLKLFSLCYSASSSRFTHGIFYMVILSITSGANTWSYCTNFKIKTCRCLFWIRIYEIERLAKYSFCLLQALLTWNLPSPYILPQRWDKKISNAPPWLPTVLDDIAAHHSQMAASFYRL